MSSCERPWKRSASDALPSSVSKRYSLSIANPRQFLPPPRQLVAAPREILFRLEQLEPRRQPLFTRSGHVCCHRCLLSQPSFTRRRRSMSEIVVRQRAGGMTSGGSDKCDGIPMDSLITAAARALAAGDPLGALKRVALRDDAPALALRGSRWRSSAISRARRRCCGGRRARSARREAVARARCIVAEAEIALVVARPGLAGEGARRGAGDARSARRPRQRRARAVSRGAAPPPDRAPRRGRAGARRARPRAASGRVADRSRAGGGGDRDAAPADEGGACRARPRRARGARCTAFRR